MDIQFGKTARDYATHRQGFPESFFDGLMEQKIVNAGDRLLDIGTGTGTIARGFSRRGCDVVGLDPSAELLQQAKILAQAEACDPVFVEGRAEATKLNPASFDVVTAGQCWHWFNSAKTAQEVKRLLRPDGLLIIAHYDWLPLRGNVVKATEALIEEHNPKWTMGGGTGIYPEWPRDVGEAGFQDIETSSYDVNAIYTPENWRGRIRASAGVAASLTDRNVVQFDQQLAEILADQFPGDELVIPHRVFMVTGRKPGG